jgi:hypothetical protein
VYLQLQLVTSIPIRVKTGKLIIAMAASVKKG